MNVVRILNTILLAGILWCLFEIRTHMPPTLGEIMRPANAEQKKELLSRQLSSVSVEVENSPLQVEISN